MEIEIILWNEICCLVSERKGGGGGCERRCLGHEYGSIEVLGGNWRGYSLTTGGQYMKLRLRTGTSLTYGDWDSSSAESGGVGRSSG